jgi:hypothetical protein
MFLRFYSLGGVSTMSDQRSCDICKGEGWVCENHPNVAWEDGEATCCNGSCGAGMLCECEKKRERQARIELIERMLASQSKYKVIFNPTGIDANEEVHFLLSELRKADERERVLRKAIQKAADRINPVGAPAKDPTHFQIQSAINLLGQALAKADEI